MNHFPTVYIAGPQVFLPTAEQFFSEARSICHELKMLALCPYAPHLMFGRDIWQYNITLLRKAEGMVVDVTSFRGADMDPGSAWESGFMHALNKPIVNYSTDERSLLEKTKQHFGFDINEPNASFPGGVMPDGMKVEPFGQRNNLMPIMAAVHDVRGDLRSALTKLKEHFDSKLGPG